MDVVRDFDVKVGTLADDGRAGRGSTYRLVDDRGRVGVPEVSRSAGRSCDVGGLRVSQPSPGAGPDVRPLAGLETGRRPRLAGQPPPAWLRRS